MPVTTLDTSEKREQRHVHGDSIALSAERDEIHAGVLF